MATLSAKAIHELARRAGLSSHDATTATAIALAESAGRPDAVGDRGLVSRTWGPSIGLWQVRSLNVQKGTGGVRDATRLRDPFYNARSMVAISNGGALWTPWSTYTNGAYRAHLPAARAAAGGSSSGGLSGAALDRAVAGDVARINSMSDAQVKAALDAPASPTGYKAPGTSLADHVAAASFGGDAAGKVGGAAADALGLPTMDQVREIVLVGLAVSVGLMLVIGGAVAAVKGGGGNNG